MPGQYAACRGENKAIDRLVYLALDRDRQVCLLLNRRPRFPHLELPGDPTPLSMKTAIVIMSDPNAGTEEALGRLNNALALAHEGRAAGDTVDIVFKGAGTRWPAELAKISHPANERYQLV